jgi:MFS family permease
MRRPLFVAAGAFACFGFFWGSWAVATVEVERYTGLSDAGLGVLLSCAVAVGGAAAAIAGGLMARRGPHQLLPTLLIPWGLCSIAASIVPGKVAFVAVFGVAIASGGLADMAMNTSATVALGGSAGGMVRFHGIFNVGTLCGAGLVAAFVSENISWRWTWLVSGSAALLIGISASPGREPDSPRYPVAALVEPPVVPTKQTRSMARSFVAIRAEGLIGLAFAFALTAVVEGGIDTWGVLYLRTRLATGVLVGAGAYAAGQLIAATTRASGAPLMTRLGHRRGLVVGAGVAAAGLLLEAVSNSTPLAACGLAIAAGGISLCWPLTMARLALLRPSGEKDDDMTTMLVGGFTSAGYLGWVLGPAVIGTLADHEGLRAGLILLIGLATLAGATLAWHPNTSEREVA